MDAGISSVVLLTQAVNLGVGVVAAGAVYGILRLLDWNGNTPFSVHIAIIDDDPKALALYRGLRFLAVAYFVATLLK